MLALVVVKCSMMLSLAVSATRCLITLSGCGVVLLYSISINMSGRAWHPASVYLACASSLAAIYS